MSTVALYYRNTLANLFETYGSLFNAFLMGILLTAICQSSSLVIGVIILLSGNQIILPEYASAAVMGLNIGTSSTLLIASLGLSKGGKLGAVFQLVYNSLCAVILFSAFPAYIHIVEQISPTSSRFVANSHTLFNIVASLLLVFGWKYIERIVKWIVY